MSSEKIVFVTGNKNKLAEVNAILGADKLDNVSLDLEEVQGTVEEVSTHKAKSAAERLGKAVLVEDTALEFSAFGRLPGPYIKWFKDSVGNQGLVDMLYKFEDKSARAICTFAYCGGPGQEVQLFQGIAPGKIVSPRGKEVFGWNPIFEPEGHNQTYAELDDGVKNSISHRSKALDKLKEFLKDRA